MLFNYLKTLEDKCRVQRVKSLEGKAGIVERHVASLDSLHYRMHPFFTLHGISHSEGVLDNLGEICKCAGILDVGGKRSLNRAETFCLIAAAYLHDIGMIYPLRDRGVSEIGEEEVNEIRERHEIASAEYINEHQRVLYLESYEVPILQLICKGHRRKSEISGEDYKDDNAFRTQQVRVRLLTALLRIADELDLDHRRAPENDLAHSFHYGFLGKVSLFHWVKHHHTTSIHFESLETGTQKIVRVNIGLRGKTKRACDALWCHINEPVSSEIRKLNPHFANTGFQMELIPYTFQENLNIGDMLRFKKEISFLLADDDQDFRAELVKELKELGFAVFYEASNLAEVEDLVVRNQTRFDLACIDNYMPDFQDELVEDAGQRVLGWLAQSDSPPILAVCSGSNEEKLQAVARQYNAICLPKKMTEKEIAKKLEGAFDKRCVFL
ncbi:MAG: response regulator [Candidatus Zixiibacteriota bacterium]